jgi:type IV pilus assembly protein PilA
MYKNRSRGFTLIELLVVIAIIGVLSAVVLASLNTARNKGNDAAAKSNLSTVQTQAALDYDGNSNSYGATAVWNANISASAVPVGTGTPGGAVPLFGTSGDSTIYNALFQAASAEGASSLSYGSNSSSFVVIVKLTNPSSPVTYWCVDGNGVAKAETVAPGSTAAAYPSGYGLTTGTFACI